MAEKREMTVARFVTAANEVTIGGFWREHARGELKTRRDHEILEFLSPCWGKEFMVGVFSAKETIFGAFILEILNMPISLLLALYLVYPRYLFNMGPAYMFSRGVETLRIDGYLALVLLTHGELVSFHRLMKYGEPLSMGRTHSSIDTYSYKCAAGLKTLLVQYLLMQNRHLTGEEKSPKTRDEWKKVNGGPMGIIRGLEEVVTCIYGPAVTYAFPDPLVTAYRYSVTHLSLISIMDGTTLNWCQQEVLRAQMSNTVLFGKVKDAELMVYSFRGQLQCRMGGKREGPIETYPKFWNLNTLTASGHEVLSLISILDGTTLNWCQQEVLRAQMSNTVLFGKVKDAELMVYSFRGQLQCRMGGKREGPIETYPKFCNLNALTASGQEVLRVPAWKKSFELVKRELEAILEKEVLPKSIPEFPTVRRMTLGMNSSLVVPSLFARAATNRRTTEGVHRWLGSPVHRLHCSGLFSH